MCFAGIHGAVNLHSTPAVYLSDITIATEHSYNTATLKLAIEVTGIVSYRKSGVVMYYELRDMNGSVADTVGGEGMFRAELTIFRPTLWWPKGMRDKPGSLYTLEVSSKSFFETWCRRALIT